MKRTTIIVLIIILLLAGGTFLYFSISAGKAANGQAANGKKAPLVQVVSASRSTISEVLELTGSVEAYRVAQLASPAEGPVENLRVREGDRVRAGNTLLSIGRTQGADALVNAMREDLKKEEENLRRTRQLVENNALPGEQLDQA
ncbi:MAG: biotin/lipoyl-binding protein, partial [Candidatus Glassbacteria bacterium]|nr:biotin/lipoyl-binding protein [Candidatus Glassbacteria bacterium]